MANTITSLRLVLLYVVILIAHLPVTWLHLVNILLLILVFIGDGLDGYIARKNNESSVFGAMYDILADRLVELSLWVAFVSLGQVSIWVPIIFFTRGIIVDAIRSSEIASENTAPFDIARSKIGKWLVASRFMRIFYAVTKAVTFCWILLMIALPEIFTSIWDQWHMKLTLVSTILISLSIFLCLIRGIPVIWEFLEKQSKHSNWIQN